MKSASGRLFLLIEAFRIVVVLNFFRVFLALFISGPVFGAGEVMREIFAETAVTIFYDSQWRRPPGTNGIPVPMRNMPGFSDKDIPQVIKAGYIDALTRMGLNPSNVQLVPLNERVALGQPLLDKKLSAGVARSLYIFVNINSYSRDDDLAFSFANGKDVLISELELFNVLKQHANLARIETILLVDFAGAAIVPEDFKGNIFTLSPADTVATSDITAAVHYYFFKMMSLGAPALLSAREFYGFTLNFFDRETIGRERVLMMSTPAVDAVVDELSVVDPAPTWLSIYDPVAGERRNFGIKFMGYRSDPRVIRYRSTWDDPPTGQYCSSIF